MHTYPYFGLPVMCGCCGQGATQKTVAGVPRVECQHCGMILLGSELTFDPSKLPALKSLTVTVPGGADPMSTSQAKSGAVLCRFATASDRESILRIDRSQCRPALLAEDVCNSLEWPSRFVVLAERSSRDAVGFAIVLRGKKNYEICRLVVERSFERLGIGSQLLEFVETAVQTPRQRRVLRVAISEQSTGAAMFFKAAGYQSRLLRNHICDDHDAYLFFKQV